jgi:hypothetical protein
VVARPRETGGAARPVSGDQVVTLGQLDITKTQSALWKKLAEIPDHDFEGLLRSFHTAGIMPSAPAPIRTWF